MEQTKISFTKQIKEELCLKEVEEQEAKSIIASFIRLSGTLIFQRQSNKLVLKTETAFIAKYIYKLLKTYFPELNVSFSFLKQMKLYKATEYLININSGSEKLLEALDIDFLDSKISQNLQNKEEKIRGYLIGTFLSTGSCNNPSSSNYHLEFYGSDENYAKSLLKLINKIKNVQLLFKIIKRRNHYVVYLKRSDQISDFLAYLGATNACMDFENIRVDRDFSNSNNRLINCDSYNFKKTLEISNQQIEYIKYIDEKLGVSNIQNEKLRTLCEIRVKNPEANYNELATLVGEALDQSVSKSNINHLFIRLKKTYERLKDGLTKN